MAQAGNSQDGLRVFISYRRSDCQPQANGLHDGLAHRLPSARLFMDVDSIPPGVDFEEHIRSEIDGCDVVLVLIGDNWLDVRAGTEIRRIDEPNDFVRLEVESALANANVRVIPVLVEGAQMPEITQLPVSIQRLARLNAFDLDDRRWKADLEGITKVLEDLDQQRRQQSAPIVPAPPMPPAAPFAPTASRRAVPLPPPPPPVLPSGRFYGVDDGPFLERSKVGWIAIAVAFFTCGFLVAVPVVRSALIHPALRTKLFVAAGVLQALAFAGVGIFSSAPTDSEGTPVGVASNVGMGLLLITMLVGVGIGIYFREPKRDVAARG